MDILGTIRESIQNHRNITWIFSRSHDISELTVANYLISARTIEIPFFTHEETQLLLTDPLKHSRLLNQSSTKRPMFSPDFWGPGGIDEIHHQSGEWPFFVQLIAETVIDMLNDFSRTSVDKELFDYALYESLANGKNAFLNLVNEKSVLPGELEYLEGFRTKEILSLPEDKKVHASLLRRKLVAAQEGCLEMRIPFIHRWIRKEWMQVGGNSVEQVYKPALKFLFGSN